MSLLNLSKSTGSIVTLAITPNTTPFAITIPRSRPIVYVMKQSARNPAIVVAELPVTETSVASMASAIASSSLSPESSFSM